MEAHIAEPELIEVREFVRKWIEMYEKGAITRDHLASRLAYLALDLRDPDYEIAGKKEFIVDSGDVKKIEGGFRLEGRNGAKPIRLGDYLNNCKVERIEAYGEDLEELGQGMTGRLTLAGAFLILSLREVRYT